MGRTLHIGWFLGVLAASPVAAAGAASVAVRVVVHDSASVQASALAEARTLASVIFKNAGVALIFASGDEEKVCRPEPAEMFCVQVLLRPRNAVFAPGQKRTLGMTLAADSNRAVLSLYVDSVTEVARRYGLSVGTVLGIALAHELGHALLPPPSHSRDGIMQPAWEGDELRNASAGDIAFSTDQATLMRERLAQRERR